jgi:hypothetical protein
MSIIDLGASALVWAQREMPVFPLKPGEKSPLRELVPHGFKEATYDKDTIAPLPARAQFLNVIESIFSGMARAIIHNSDYKSVDHAKAAIDRHFDDRNRHFLAHPRRAGNKIWGKERVPPRFSEANNCKDPRYC